MDANGFLISDMRECRAGSEVLRDQARTAFAALQTEITDVRDIATEIYKVYKKAIDDHCVVSIACDHMLQVSVKIIEEANIASHCIQNDQVA